MKRASAPTREPVTVSRSDIESAIELLASEQAARRPRRSEFVREVAEDVNVALFLLFVMLGVVTIWFDRLWGIGLLAAAVAAFVALALLPASGLYAATRTLRSAIEGTEFATLPKALRARRKRDELGLLVIFFVAGSCGGVGAVLLVTGLIDDGNVRLSAIGLMVLAAITFAVALGMDVVRDYHYFGLVDEARTRLEAELSRAVESSDDGVELSSAQLSVLSQAETKRATRLVRDAVQDLPGVLDTSWGVTLAPGVQDYLADLAQDRPQEWRRIISTIQGLQHEPRPPQARLAKRDEAVIDADSAALTYTLDDAAQRVYVISIFDRTADDA